MQPSTMDIVEHYYASVVTVTVKNIKTSSFKFSLLSQIFIVVNKNVASFYIASFLFIDKTA